MKGVYYDNHLRKWRARTGVEEGYMRLGAYATEKEAEAALIQYYKDGLLPLQKRRGNT